MGNYLTFNFRRTFSAKISHLIFADRLIMFYAFYDAFLMFTFFSY